MLTCRAGPTPFRMTWFSVCLTGKISVFTANSFLVTSRVTGREAAVNRNRVLKMKDFATEDEALFALESDEIHMIPEPPHNQPDMPQEDFND